MTGGRAIVIFTEYYRHFINELRLESFTIVMSSQNPEISQRAKVLFKGLVERYIAGGQPVGSKALSQDSKLGLSSATVRNVMAELEALGLVASPHTSAGRVPTDFGLRMFVDTLLTSDPIDDKAVKLLKKNLDNEHSISDVVQSASRLLAGLSHMAGLVVMPRTDLSRLNHVEFMALSDKRLLAVLVTSDGSVLNKVVPVDRDYEAAELQRAGNFLSNKFKGRELSRVRADIIEELTLVKAEVDSLMSTFLRATKSTLPKSGNSENLVVRGESNLLSLDDQGRDMSRLKILFQAFAEKQDLLLLLDQCLDSEGVQIFIGRESGYDFLQQYSVVTAPYEVDNKVFGALAVVGPTRMPYDRVVSLVDMTAKLLSSALNRHF